MKTSEFINCPVCNKITRNTSDFIICDSYIEGNLWCFTMHFISDEIKYLTFHGFLFNFTEFEENPYTLKNINNEIVYSFDRDKVIKMNYNDIKNLIQETLLFNI